MSPTLAVSPLSPERAWAIQRSWRGVSGAAGPRGRLAAVRAFLCERFLPVLRAANEPPFQGEELLPRCPAAPLPRGQDLYLHVWLNLLAVNQRRPVCNDLLDGWPPPRKARHTRRPGEHQRRNLPGESLDWWPFSG